ncbi:small ribosomal subunit protein eS10-like [Phalacrocorax aristotelis]|uniref:small ribosomal subunit protein eS10-like n=1 Tax=Phalacrocorax aristotelis TaxID=126867 RepID=UPI003F4B3786
MVAGMLMPLERLRAILELLFREGVLVAEKDPRPQRTHPQLPGVPNVEVLRAMASLRSRHLVRETFAWRHFYWYLTDDGIAYLRQYLRLPPEIVPLSLQRARRPAGPARRLADTSRRHGDVLDAGPGKARPAGGDRQHGVVLDAGPGKARPAGGDRLYRRKEEGERQVEPAVVAAAAAGGVSQPPPQPGPAPGIGGDPRAGWEEGSSALSPGCPPPRVLSWVGVHGSTLTLLLRGGSSAAPASPRC